jgi:transposase InsO family protein
LGVSQAWFYKWRNGDRSARHRRRAALSSLVASLFGKHHGSYGSPRITADLRELGWRVSENTVAAVMAEQHLVARPKHTRRSTTRPDKSARKAPDAVGRDFRAPAGEGVFYLASILDLHSRRCVGFALGERHDTELARAALCVAIAVRGGSVTGVVFHTDQGGEGGFNWSSQRPSRRWAWAGQRVG